MSHDSLVVQGLMMSALPADSDNTRPIVWLRDSVKLLGHAWK